jgi:CRISPR system Cascade subunit CasE
MMYLSRLILNPRNRRVQKDLANPHDLHRSLMCCFPDSLDLQRERVLFRIDASPRANAFTVLLQSTLEPGWDWLEEGRTRGYLLRPPETKEFNLVLAPGQTLAFRLRANPTVKRRRESSNGSLRSVRDPLYREQDQRAWLDRKGEQGGFRVLRVDVFPEGDLVAWKDNGRRHKLTLFAVRFDGLLQVADPGRLRETVRQGIGSGKGLGFGLLSLARPS